MLSACAQKEDIPLVDPRVLAIPVVESHEPMIDLKKQSELRFGPSPEVPNNNDYTKMRRTVYKKLVEAQNALPDGLRFCLYEGYRSLGLQEKLFTDRYQLLKTTHPNWNHGQLFKETTQLVSPVINLDGSRNIPPHSTGAAIDIYLLDSADQVVDMGIKVEDWMLDVDGSISKTDSPIISAEAKHNRAIMSSSLQRVGFVNYTGEYWHWSYGDRYWAYCIGEKTAPYGSIE